MLVEEDFLISVPLYHLTRGEVFKMGLDGVVWIKGECYPTYGAGHKFKGDLCFPCISLKQGIFSWIKKDTLVYRAKNSVCKVDFI